MNHSTFLPRLIKSVRSFPDAPALTFPGQTVTYRELARMVEGIRARLGEVASSAEQHIAVYGSQDPWTYASILAVMATGRAYVPLNPAAPSARNRSCLDQAGVRTLLCTQADEVIDEWKAADAGLAVVETAGTPLRELTDVTPVSADSMAYLLFTSGSTGVPKGVPVFHRNLDCFLSALLDQSDLGFTFEDRFLQMFDLTFDLSVMSFAAPLSIGASCHPVVQGTGPGFLSVAKTLQSSRITVALMVPSVLSFLQRYFDEIRLPELRLSLFCGEALPTHLARAWRICAPNARVFNVYGPTEATIFCSSYELSREPVPADEYQGVVSIGRPLPGTSFRIVDEQLTDVPDREKGELIILGGQVTSHYWQNPDKSRAAFVTMADGASGYRSGDVAFDVDGNYYYCGRVDHQLKVDGFRVEPGEVEQHARSLPGVLDAVLVGRVEGNGRTVAHLFLRIETGATPPSPKEVRAYLARHLPSYMVPHQVSVVASFPLNQNGKVDRKALLASLSGN